MFSKYTVQARFIPTIIVAIPIFVLQYKFFSKEIINFFIFLAGLKFAGNITISIAVLYFVSQINRLVSKTFFEKEEIYMPTTDFLLLNNSEYSEEYKQKIYKKLENEFDLKIPSKLTQKENELNTRKRIAEAVSLARKRVGSGKLLLQHNIEYGFWRNLVGGSIFAILFSVIILYLSYAENNYTFLVVSTILLVIFLIILFCNKFFIDRAGKMYAKVLIQEYMEKIIEK